MVEEGLQKIFLDLGHVGIFKKLMACANLDIEQEKEIKNLITESMKNSVPSGKNM